LFLLSTFRLPVSLTVIGRGRRATLLPLLLVLGLLLLLGRRLSVSALHFFSLTPRFIRRSSMRWRRDLPMKSGRWTSVMLSAFTCAHRRRRAEPNTFIVTLRRILSCPTMPRTWLLLLPWTARGLATMLLLLRRCTL
jgi:hypothetical protein